MAVSKLARECFSFVRTETNGLGGQRMFYFGLTAGPSEMVDGEMVFCRGYQLGKVTDFYLGPPGSPPPWERVFAPAEVRQGWSSP